MQGFRLIEKGISVIGSTTFDKIAKRDLSGLNIGSITTYSGITYSRHGIKTLAVKDIAKRDPEIISNQTNFILPIR
jgi:hypothetical protein